MYELNISPVLTGIRNDSENCYPEFALKGRVFLGACERLMRNEYARREGHLVGSRIEAGVECEAGRASRE
ncbi:hypothetical protein [Paraburkholderia sartisoli]|uniref:hypothetical protein n=1 Tax=Paraburkholderia sartisoli TaxID=83784 RepID=UPI0011607825|nr:hypothetical protein [Paraburkholderia sartisoli]